MTAGIYNFTIEQGADFSRVLTWKDGSGNPVNLNGYSGKLQARDKLGNLLIDFGVNGSISVSQATSGPTEGQVTITLPNTFTTTLTFDSAVYDLKLTSSTSSKSRLLQGIVTLSKGTTV